MGRRSEKYMGSHVHAPAALRRLWTASKHPLGSRVAFKLFQGIDNPPCMAAALIKYRQQIHQSQMLGSADLPHQFGVEVLRFKVTNSGKVVSHLICCIGVFKWTSSSELALNINMQ